jgi:hypothetical protein
MREQDGTEAPDKFVDMVSATAEVDLRLSDFRPCSSLRSETHYLEHARFPVIDYHNHLDSMEPKDVLSIMDECGIEHVVNITMQVGQKALDMMDKYHAAAPSRFSTIGWMDWDGVERSDFVQVTIDRSNA